ncbi:MAG TPA: glycosyltransferase [Acidobacteriota bacterium]|nr:glycosyltransferase [Acidobacteriota bacterium]
MQGFSLVVTTRNRASSLQELLPQLLALETPGLEVVIVDNDSDDKTREVARLFPVKYLYFPGGLAEARHIGSMAASGDYISYVDDDCKPGHPRMLLDILSAFAANPDAGIVGSRIENVGFKGMQQFKGYTRFGRNAMLEFEQNPPAADVFASMAITIRKDVYLKTGGFDPAFSRGCEEVDLCMKVRAAGYRLVYHPDSFFYHYEMGSHFRFNPVHNRDYMRLYSFFKYFPPSSIGDWTRFLRNEWALFLNDIAQIYRQYSLDDFRSTHLPFLNKILGRSRFLRKLLRWPLMIGAICISPILRRLFIPSIWLQARRRKQYEQRHFGLSYA